MPNPYFNLLHVFICVIALICLWTSDIFYWSIIALQCFVNFCCTTKWISYVCCCSVAKLCLILCSPIDCSTQAPLPCTISWNLFKFMSTESMMLSNHLILYRPFSLLPSIFHSIRVFSNESALCLRWNRYRISYAYTYITSL